MKTVKLISLEALQEVVDQLVLICIVEARDADTQSEAFQCAMRAREILHANGVENIEEPASNEGKWS